MKYAIVGLGSISKYYMAALGTKVAVACDSQRSRLDGYSRIATCGDVQELSSHAIDAAVVCTPTDTHPAIVRALIRRGVAVLCEKPLALNAREAAALRDEARAADVPLFTGYHRRYNRELPTVRLAPGIYIDSLECLYLENIEEHVGGADWYFDESRSGHGCLTDNGTNALDLVLELVGSIAIGKATVTYETLRGRRLATKSEIAFAHKHGHGLIRLDWLYPGEKKVVNLTLSDGSSYEIDLLRGSRELKDSLWHEYERMVKDFETFCGQRLSDDRTVEIMLAHDLIVSGAARIDR